MIEIFKSRRYIGLCIGLVILCLIVMILEGLFTQDTHHGNVVDHGDEAVDKEPVLKPNPKPDPRQTACWLHEDFHVIDICSKCSDSEFKTNFTACQKTGFVEQIRCKSGVQVIRSCVHASAIASFVKFELIMIVMAAIGWYVCYRRESILIKAAMDRINKQLSCGV